MMGFPDPADEGVPWGARSAIVGQEDTSGAVACPEKTLETIPVFLKQPLAR